MACTTTSPVSVRKFKLGPTPDSLSKPLFFHVTVAYLQCLCLYEMRIKSLVDVWEEEEAAPFLTETHAVHRGDPHDRADGHDVRQRPDVRVARERESARAREALRRAVGDVEQRGTGEPRRHREHGLALPKEILSSTSNQAAY